MTVGNINEQHRALTMQDEPDEYERETNYTAEQSEQHQVIHFYITIRIQNRRPLVKTATKHDTEIFQCRALSQSSPGGDGFESEW